MKFYDREHETFSGNILEKYFRAVMAESKEYSDIQSYWNSKRENKIDIVAINDMNKRLVFCEVKRNPRRINTGNLIIKAKDIVTKYPKFAIEYKGLSLEDM